LSLLYALADGSAKIRLDHLQAALALWDYAERSLEYIFGQSLGDPVADEIYAALSNAGDQGMSRTDIRDIFKRNQSSDKIQRALSVLVKAGKVRFEMQTQDGSGRPSERWFSC
jgi:hypothetical protein